jgi:hypothetical protein
MLTSVIAKSANALALGRILDQTEDYVVARRNALIGIWAGDRLGFEGDDLARYAVAVMESDLQEVGHRDVVRKVATDFARSGIAIGEAEIERLIGEAHRTAYREFLIRE